MTETVVTHYGLKLHFRDGEVVHVEHFLDKDEIRAAKTVFRAGDQVINAGNGSGATSTFLAGIVGSENVRSYEPNRALVEMAKGNVVFEGSASEVQWGILSTEEGWTSFGFRNDWWNSAKTDSGRRADRTGYVPSFDINNEIHRHRANALLLDIEGEEAKVIPHINPAPLTAIVCELHQDAERLRAIIEAWGFTTRYWIEQFPDIFVIGASRATIPL